MLTETEHSFEENSAITPLSSSGIIKYPKWWNSPPLCFSSLFCVFLVWTSLLKRIEVDILPLVCLRMMPQWCDLIKSTFNEQISEGCGEFELQRISLILGHQNCSRDTTQPWTSCSAPDWSSEAPRYWTVKIWGFLHTDIMSCLVFQRGKMADLKDAISLDFDSS